MILYVARSSALWLKKKEDKCERKLSTSSFPGEVSVFLSKAKEIDIVLFISKQLT